MTRLRFYLCALGCWLLAASGVSWVLADEPAGEGPPAVFAEQVRPFLANYCFDCHSGDEPPADLDLEKFRDIATVLDHRKDWHRVLKQIKSGAMPPEDAEKPSSEEVAAAVRWIEDEVFRCGTDEPADPGRITIHRLNRNEYNNTIHDLLGIDFKPADDFPSDDVGYGFDNMADVLSLPPVLLEKYLTAAGRIAQRAIVAEDLTVAKTVTFEAEALKATGGGRPSAEGHVLYSTGEIPVEYSFPSAGKYIVRAKAYGQQAGDEPTKMSVSLDSETIETFDVTAVAEAPAVYEARIEIPHGVHRVAVAFLNDYYRPDDPDPNNRDRNLIVDYLEIDGPYEATPPPLPESHRRILFDSTDSDSQQDADATAKYAEEVIRRFATRAFRRPVTDEEVKGLGRFVELAGQNGDSFERGIQLAVQATLVSPHFLFRIELDRATEGDSPIHPISEFDLAARLSYFIWSSMPDEELFALAGQGKLREQLAIQVRRMLKDEKSDALVENFATQWLQIGRLSTASPDPKLFTNFDADLRRAMRQETTAFFASVMREDGSVLDFLDADYTFVNEALAGHYGIEGVSGDEFRRVAVDRNLRGGVLTQASILTVTSNPTRTSPVKRGKWVLEQLLGESPPPPPAAVEKLNESEEAVLSGSLRQRFEQHRADPSCAVCHARMDPLGFGLENYDAVGAWRVRDGEFDIDASGTLPDGRSFAGPAGLKEILLGNKDSFVRCLVEKMLTYALGRGLEYYDKCSVDEISRSVADNDYRFTQLVIEITNSTPFQMRRGSGDSE